MNSSAKMTAISLLAVAGLGAAVFMGCTVGSGTVDDTDGGTLIPAGDSGAAGDTGTTSVPDAGPDAGGKKCESKQNGIFGSPTCQACVEGACCAELKGCFDLPADVAAGQQTCNEYATCIDFCGEKPEAEREVCYGDCDSTAAPGVKAAYEKITACAGTNCAAECQ